MIAVKSSRSNQADRGHRMAEHDQDIGERAESFTQKSQGSPMAVESIMDNFALYGLSKRTAALQEFDAELKTEIGSGSHTLRRRAQLMGMRKKMLGVHEALRKAKR
jgi:hypothetical protein